MIRRFVVMLLLAVPGLHVFSQTVEDAFVRGNEAYRAGKYLDAAAAYEEILKQGRSSAEVYYNLGSAHYRAGNIARAILAYERAIRIDPGDVDLRHNLALANLHITDRIEAVPELFLMQWMRAAASITTLRTGSLLFIVAWILLFGALTVMFAVRSVEAMRWARLAMAVGMLLVLATGALLSLQVWQHDSGDAAIVTAQVVTAKSSPDDQSVDAFVVHEGLKVRIGDRLSDWVKITLADGKVGWIRSSQCEQI